MDSILCQILLDTKILKNIVVANNSLKVIIHSIILQVAAKI